MIEILYNIIISPITDFIDLLFNYFAIGLNDVYFAIFIVSFFVNLVCLPMYIQAEKIQEKERKIQEDMDPEIRSIKKNFKGDERFMLLRTCYRQHKYHPVMALRTSLSLLIQVPFFMAAYIYFNNSKILAYTNFINEKTLAQPDGLISFLGISINVLPIVMTLINIASAEIYAHKKQLKDRIQMYSFAIIFLVLLYNSPAGLVIYWTFNNLFSLFKNIGLKQKSPISFLNKSCLIIAFILIIKIFYAQIHYFHKKTSILLLCLIPYYIFNIIPGHIKEKFKKYFNFKFSEDMKLFLLSAITLSIYTGLLIPSIIFSSVDYIQLLNNDIWLVITGIFSKAIGLYVFCAVVLYYFSNNKLRTLLTVVYSIITIYFAINLCLYNGDLGLLSVDFKFKMPQYSILKILSDIFIIILLPLIVILGFVKNKTIYIKNIILCLFFTSLTFSLFNIYKLNKNLTVYNLTNHKNKMNNDDIQKPIVFSKKGKNVIIIFIDRCIGSYAREIFEEDSELKNKFNGFILYPNIVSYYMQTAVAYPPMIAGYEYTPENMEKRVNETYEQKTNEAYLVLPKIFINNGYISTIIQPHSYFNNDDFSAYEGSGIHLYKLPKNTEYYNNFEYEDRVNIFLKEMDAGISFFTDKKQFLNTAFSFSNYILLPSFAKTILYEPEQINSGKAWDEMLIHEYKQLASLPYITKIENSNNNYFTIFNSDAMHINKYDNGYYKEHKIIETEVLYIIGKYMDYLKDNGVFDNTRIIVVSDHGTWGQVSKYLEEPYIKYNPILMVKDFYSNNDYSLDFSFMTNADTPILAADKIIANPKNPYTNKFLKQYVNKENVKILSGHLGPQIQQANLYTPRLNKHGYHTVHDNIFYPQNWILKPNY